MTHVLTHGDSLTLVLVALYLLVFGSAAAWVYTDAKAKGAPDPGVWALLAMTVIGLPWWIVKRQQYL